MEILGLLLEGFAVALEPINLALIVAGCIAGLFIGAMRGWGRSTGSRSCCR